MNIIFKNRVKLAFLAFSAFLFSACIQGPWEYRADNTEVYKGIYVTGYMVADAGVEDFCISKMNSLKEEASLEFSFYNSANIQITGDFGSGAETVTLIPHPSRANCFVTADSSKVVQRSNSYNLSMSVVWDSLGSVITSNFTAIAQVPTQFEMKDSARISPPDLPAKPSSPEKYPRFLLGLDERIIAVLFDYYQDSILQYFVADENGLDLQDTAGLEVFVGENIDSIYIISEAVHDTLPNRYYARHDSIPYLTGTLNTSSHYFTSIHSEDTKGVLTTQKLHDSLIIVESNFDRLFGQEPELAEEFVTGTSTRLLLQYNWEYDGRFLLDSIPVVNSWLYGGNNTLYFYGVEEAYYDYFLTNIEEAENPKVRKLYNINGGKGVFVGAIKDSFEMFVTAPDPDQFVQGPRWEVRADYCSGSNEDVNIDWWSEQECREYLIPYCERMNWNDTLEYVNCDIPAYYLDLRDSSDLATQYNLTYEEEDIEMGRRMYCVLENFDIPNCASFLAEARSAEKNDTKDWHREFCRDKNWQGESCGWALVRHVQDLHLEGKTSAILEREAKIYCQNNTEETICKEGTL